MATTCARCGHPLVGTIEPYIAFTQRGNVVEVNAMKWNCDVCGSQGHAPSSERYHCAGCGFDACPACYEKRPAAVLDEEAAMR